MRFLQNYRYDVSMWSIYGQIELNLNEFKHARASYKAHVFFCAYFNTEALCAIADKILLLMTICAKIM